MLRAVFSIGQYILLSWIFYWTDKDEWKVTWHDPWDVVRCECITIGTKLEKNIQQTFNFN
jgi:hypothetical protein